MFSPRINRMATNNSRLQPGVLFIAAFLCLNSMVDGSWTQAHRDQITKLHNDYRKGVPGACGMKMIKYDKKLEKEAKAWAGKCVFKHQEKGRGENIAWYTKYTGEPELITKMAKMWYDEVSSFDYDAYSCGAACHYTQLVWSDSTKVGCYAEDCSHLEQGGENAYFLVCFYSPPGNMMGLKPYKKDCSSARGSGNKNNKNNNKKNNKSTNNKTNLSQTNNLNPGNNQNNNNDDDGLNWNWETEPGLPDGNVEWTWSSWSSA